jgi:hypothetical protein
LLKLILWPAQQWVQLASRRTNSRVAADLAGQHSYERGGSAYGIRTRDLRLERAVSLAARRMRHVMYGKMGVAGDRGFEPRLTEPESVVLPLD